MFLGVLLKEGIAIFDYFSKDWKLAKNNMYFCFKTLKLDNIPSIRYETIWFHHVQVLKQNIKLD